MTYAIANPATVVNLAVLPPRIEVHWETQHRLVWNEMEGATEEQELTYEVTWIPELSTWRRFLKARRKVLQ